MALGILWTIILLKITTRYYVFYDRIILVQTHFSQRRYESHWNRCYSNCLDKIWSSSTIANVWQFSILRNLIGFSTKKNHLFCYFKTQFIEKYDLRYFESEKHKHTLVEKSIWCYYDPNYQFTQVYASFRQYMFTTSKCCKQLSRKQNLHLIHPNDDNVNKNIVQTYMY